MDAFLQDVRYAARSLRKAPTFTVLAVLLLTLGIGATSAIFSLVHAVLLRPLPFPNPEHIVTAISVQSARGLRDGGVAYADYLDWRNETGIFQLAALWRPANVDLTGGERPERIRALAVTGEYFAVLGVAPTLGHLFDTAAERSTERPVVLSEAVWRRLFGSQADAIGKTILLNGTPHTVTGVLADHYVWPSGTEAIVPLRLDPALDKSLLRRDNFIFRSMLRLRPDVSIEQARGRVATLANAIAEQYPESRKYWSYDVVALHKYTVGDEFERALLILFCAVALVLLIACANIANLLLARGTERRRELAVRAALGASTARIRRVVLAESLVLSVLGGSGGLILGYWLSHALVAIAPDNTPLVSDLALSWPIVLFTGATALATALVVGLIPAVQGTFVAPRAVLHDGRTSTARAGRLRDVLVTGEIALAVVLLITSALTVRSLSALLNVDAGVDVSNVLSARLIVPASRYADAEKRSLFYRTLTERVAALPGVQSVGLTSRMPAGGLGAGLGRVFLVEGQPEPPAAPDHPAQWTVADPGYFQTLRIPLVRGRTFTDRDTASSTPVIVISERMAEQMFPGQDPLAKRIRSWRDENVLREIVGVVKDVKYFGLADKPRSAVYVPHAQDSWGTMMLAVKTMGPPQNLVNALRAVVTEADPALALGDVSTLQEASARSVSDNRFIAQLLAAFALLALLLAAVGVYGVMAYAVSLRAPEIAVRVALGAQRRDVALMILNRGMSMTLLGLLLGGAAAVAAARAMRTLLPEIGPGDPLSYAAASGTLLIAAALACAVPALRAARLDPLDVLRQA